MGIGLLQATFAQMVLIFRGGNLVLSSRDFASSLRLAK
jgi:hypothetical protein